MYHRNMLHCPPQPVLAKVYATAGQNLVVWCHFPFVTNGAAVGVFEHPLNSSILEFHPNLCFSLFVDMWCHRMKDCMITLQYPILWESQWAASRHLCQWSVESDPLLLFQFALP